MTSRSMDSLAAVLQNPAIWRGGDCAPEPQAIPTGHASLDAVLPGGGWPASALTEIVLAREGIGELTLTLPALARLQAQRRDIVWIAPPHVPYAPALARGGIDLARFMIVRCASLADQLWAFEQALRAPECGAAFAWLGTADERVLRRLQIAARDGSTWGVLWRRPAQRAIATASPLRLAVDRCEDRLSITVMKRRGAELARPVMLEVDAARIDDAAGASLQLAAAALRDPRTSAGRALAFRVKRHVA